MDIYSAIHAASEAAAMAYAIAIYAAYAGGAIYASEASYCAANCADYSADAYALREM